jgi:hypothetical protein
MPQLSIVADRACFAAATDLMAMFGDDAGFEAAARADSSRDAGNVLSFCHWRQVERLIVVLSTDQPLGSIH